MSAHIGVIVVTHRSAAVLPDLLTSLAAHEPGVETVVVDSGSGTDLPMVPPEIEIVALANNEGFASACNAGAASLLDKDVDHLICLNPDVRLQGPSLTQLVNGLRQRPRVGIATGPVVDGSGKRVSSAWGPTSPARAAWFASGLQLPRLRGAVGRLLPAAGGMATATATLASDDVLVDGHVLGGAMAVRRECWEELGGFDEDYFLYWEDADLCHRARQRGWEVRVLPCTPIVHQAGTSSAGVVEEQRWRWYVDGAETFARKHLDDRGRRRLLAALRWGRRLRR